MTEVKFRNAKMDMGRLVVELPYDQRGKIMKWLNGKKDKDYTLILKEFQKKRSLDANAKMWALINELSAVHGIPPVEIYRSYIPDVGKNYWVMPVLPGDVKSVSEDWCRGHIGRMVEDMGECMVEELEGYRTLKLYRGSSEYDGKTFSRLLNLVIQECCQVGIETMSEREISLMIDEVDKAYAKRHEGHGL